MTVSARNRTAAIIAIIGGILLLIGGSTGMAGFLSELSNIIQDLLGGENQVVATIFWILIIIATLGGLAVIIGGLLIYKNHIIIGKILITLGAGMGIIGLIISLISALAQGESIQFFSWLTTSFLGVGIVLTLVARFMAKREKDEDKKKKRK
jgi:signal transduction histidine kinase